MKNVAFIKFSVGGFCKESIKYLYLSLGMGVNDGLHVGGAPKMHDILCLSRARHSHLGIEHLRGSSYEGMVLSYVWSLMLLAFIRVNQWWWACSVFVSVCTTLLCRFVLRLFMCLLIQHDNR